MKRYIVYTLFFGYLNNVVFGTTGEMFTSAANLEESFSNATKLEESFSNSTNLEESSGNGTDLDISSSNATELKVSPWNFFRYGIQNGTDTKLEHEFKVAIRGGKGKSKITGGNKKKITGGNKKKITGGHKRITSGNRYRKTTTGNYMSSTVYYVLLGIIGGIILITAMYYCINFFSNSTNEGVTL